MSNEITVSEYVEIRRKELAEFEENWKKNQPSEDWPERLNASDWYEQELAWRGE